MKSVLNKIDKEHRNKKMWGRVMIWTSEGAVFLQEFLCPVCSRSNTEALFESSCEVTLV